MRHLLYIPLLALAACGGPRVAVSRPAIAVDSTVRLAADVILPAERPTAGVPTILLQTRYWRSFRMRGGGGPALPQGPREPIVARLIEAGFGVVITDVRGTGASDGAWERPWSPHEVRDMRAVIDWIVAQPWSNGAVGATGVSYEGTTALLAASSHHPALKSVLARQIEWQLADETLAPGSVRNVLFPDVWGRTVDALDRGRYPDMFPRLGKLLIAGVALRDDDPDGAQQTAREAARASSDIAARARSVYTGRDAFGENGPPVDSIGPAAYAGALRTSPTILALWGSWWDGGTADAVLRADSTLTLEQAVIGGWTHEGDASASPLPRRTRDASIVHLDSVVQFFRRTVRDVPQRPDTATRVRWYEAGSDVWRSAVSWPRTFPRAWTLHTLPTTAPHDTSHTFVARGTATTGRNTRWTTGLARPVDITDRASARGLRSYVLAPLDSTLHVFGAGTFTCAMTANVPEATLHVYVESVSPDGQVRLLTEGMHRVRQDSAMHSVRGTVTVRIRPVAFALPAGWRLRVSLAGEDHPTFERVPARGDVTWRVEATRCSLTLPVYSPT
jgi:putative CocE/NonD family hydrolase